ncbi:MAG: 2-hydroxyacyl-CoA dehydratase family protein [candidate division WOR-3 bacterium]
MIDHETFERVRQEHLAELTELQRQGRKLVGYFCIYAPVEVIHATGAIPVRLMKGGHAAETAGEKFLRSDACSFCSSCLGNFELDPLYQQVDAVVAVNTCDMMRRLPETIQVYFKKPVYQLYLPRTSEPLPHRVAEFLRQLEELGSAMAALTGTRPDDRLVETVASYNRLRGLLRQAHETRRADNPLLSESAMLDLAATAWFLGPTKAESFIDSVLRIVWARPRREGSRPRLMLGGSMLTEDDRWLLEMIEERADIVTDILCTGTRWFAEDVPAAGRSLAEFYYSRIPCMHRRPNDALYEYARRQANEFRVAGVVYKTLLYCDPYNFEAKRLKTALGLPMLHLDTSYSQENREQVRTRVEAFLEML